MKKYNFVTLGRGGWAFYSKSVKTQHGSSKSRLEGYSDQQLAPHLHEVEEGSLVLDTRPAQDRPDFVSNVFRAPLVDPDLSGEEVDRVNTSGSIHHHNPHFSSMLKLHEAQQSQGELGSLDSVSPERLCAWWKERGAKVGYIQDGEIVWPE